jgi:SNF2 family DNA or RNA helicase
LSIVLPDLRDRDDIDLIIVDEVAAYRNANTKKWKILNEIVNHQKPRGCWGLTGTPTPRAPTDAFGQTKLVKPENYRGYFTQFKHDTMHQINQFRWVPKRGAEQVVSQVLSPSIRFALEDCVTLPPTIRQHRSCDLSAAQKKHYKELMDEAVTEIEGSQITAVNAAVLINKIVQVACGVPYNSQSQAIEIDFGPRLNLLKEIIEESSEKVIVFVPLTGVLSALEAKLSKEWSVAVIDGGVGKGKRNQIFSDFQRNKDPHVLLANAGTMAHGLNLTAASTIVWYAPINSNDIYTQANARIVRPGQKNITNIVHMQATATEGKIYKALAEQTRLQDVVLDLVKGRSRWGTGE